MLRDILKRPILPTIIFLVLTGLTVLDFLDNGRIDNERFLIVGLFVFSGAGAGRALDALIDRYMGIDPQRRVDKS